MLTRTQIDQCLDTLQDQLPQLRIDERADFDFLAFQQAVDRIGADVAPEDAEHVRARVQAMLEQAGLIPTEVEAEKRR